LAVVIASKSIPVGCPNITPESTAGCTTMMYAIVRNVVTPARISVRTEVWFSKRGKKRSSMARRRDEPADIFLPAVSSEFIVKSILTHLDENWVENLIGNRRGRVADLGDLRLQGGYGLVPMENP